MGNVKIDWTKLKPAQTIFGGGQGILTPYKPASAKTSSESSSQQDKSAPAETQQGSDQAKKT